MSEDFSDKSVLSRALTGFFVAFDRHCLVYFFLIGLVVGAFGPKHNPLAAAGCFLIAGGLAWYTAKAFLITTSTVVTMKKNGEPIFKAGGLTEYDSEFAKQVGDAAARKRNEDKQ